MYAEHVFSSLILYSRIDISVFFKRIDISVFFKTKIAFCVDMLVKVLHSLYLL